MVQLIPGVMDAKVGKRDLTTHTQWACSPSTACRPKPSTWPVDGVTEMDEGGNYTAFVTPNMDSVAEMRVLTNGYQAEYGRQSGGSINVITKSRRPAISTARATGTTGTKI